MLLKERITIEDNNFVVAMEGVSTLSGSQVMKSVGGGIRARVGKDSGGKSVVEAFFFDRDKFSEEKVSKWIEDNSKSIVESVFKVSENAPLGSFEDITMRVQRALDVSQDFEFPDRFAMIHFVFNDFVIANSNGQMFKIPYTDTEGKIELGEPEKVSAEFVAQEAKQLKEKLERKNAANFDIEETFTALSIKEVHKVDKGVEIEAVLIEAGTSYSKKRHYPVSTIRESAPLYAGLKMYIDHPTDIEEKTKPERGLKDWVSTITESWFEDGKAMGRIHIHDEWLAENMSDPVVRESIGISINASGRMHERTIGGQKMQVIEKIVAPRSVDWVTEAGARGRVARLIESQKREGDITMLKTVTIAELKEGRPDLIETLKNAMKAEVSEEIKKEYEVKLAEALKPYKEREAKAKAESNKQTVTKLVEASAMPKNGIARFIEDFISKNSEIEEASIEKAVKEAIAKEIEYLNSCGLGIKVGVNSGKKVEGDDKKALTEGLLKNVGIVEKKSE